MARVSRRPLAAADILDIWDYIAEDSLDEADRWVDRLDEKLDLLATQPLMGRARDELLAGLRSSAPSAQKPTTRTRSATSRP
jgi:toxin ParE1/3/4